MFRKKSRKRSPVVKQEGVRYINADESVWLTECEYAVLSKGDARVLAVVIGGQVSGSRITDYEVLLLGPQTAITFVAGMMECLEDAGVDISPLLSHESRSVMNLLSTIPVRDQ